MSIADLRQLSEADLVAKLEEFYKEQFKLRIAKSSSEEFTQSHMFNVLRKNIARVKTLLNEKQQQAKTQEGS